MRATSLQVETIGAGQPVVLLHAGICDSRMWEPLLPALAARHRVIMVDRAGFGRSPLANPVQGPTADLIELLERERSGRAAVVGASFGGLVALDLALARPDLVRSLVLVGCPLPDHEWSQEFMAYDEEEAQAGASGDLEALVRVNLGFWLAGSVPDVRDRVETMLRASLAAQLPHWAELDVELETDEIGTRLGDLELPALVLVGEHDLADFRRIGARLATAIPGAELTTVAAAGHLPSLDQPAAVAELLLDFLDRHDTADARRLASGT